ncbi:heme exporter protein CcmD [Gemmobacter sp. LW-1]|uniref:heme exporter protein CcmD n=1 Tax=Gemmobacter sp. LW-1 TaxID=1529005 RepID=UPI0009E7D174|nr:heme exporter protein CcmD [Gemmobacter sp. LW-1]
MMPDLGKYAVPVLGSYAVAIALIAAIVALSIWRSRRMKRALDAVEARAGRK